MTNGHEMRFFDDDIDDIEPASARRPTSTVEHFAEVDIDHGLGRLGVDRMGALAGIEFDERVMRSMHPDRVGACLLTALDRAAEKARQRRIDEHRRNRQESRR